MQIPLLIGLGVLWAIVLGPELIGRLRHRSSRDSVANFSRHLSSLERANAQLQGRFVRSQVRHSPRLEAPVAMRTSIPRSPRPANRPVGAQRSSQQSRRSGNVIAMNQRPVAQRSSTRQHSLRNSAPRSAAQRRQEIIVSLAALALLSLLGSITIGGWMLAVHIVIDVVFMGYLGLALKLGRESALEDRVSYLPTQSLSLAMPPQRHAASR